MSNLTLVMVWNERSLEANVFIYGDRIDTFNDTPTSASSAGQLSEPITRIIKPYPGQIDLNRERARADSNLRRLRELVLSERITAIKITSGSEFVLCLRNTLTDLASLQLTIALAACFSHADVSSERQDDISVNPTVAGSCFATLS